MSFTASTGATITINLPQRDWLQVSPRGVKSNRLGIGARLLAKVGGRQIVRELFSANSYRSQSPASVHFGLGNADSVELLSIRWPSGRVQELKNLPAGRHLMIREGGAKPAIITPGKPLPF